MFLNFEPPEVQTSVFSNI